jgi:hypothetical protein
MGQMDAKAGRIAAVTRPAAAGKPAVIDRILTFEHRGAFGGALNVYVWRHFAGTLLLANRSKFSPRHDGEFTERQLTDVDWIRLDRLIRLSDFWNLPTHQDTCGLDGFDWTISLWEDTRHHSSYGWCGGNAPFFAALGNALVEVSGFTLPPNG